MAMIPETLANLNLFVDGVSFQGDVTSLNLPAPKMKTAEHRVGGMDMAVDIDQGLEKMTAEFSTTGVRPESLKFFGLTDGTGFNGTFRGAFKGLKGKITPVVITLRGSLTTLEMGEWKAAGETVVKHTVSVTYYKLEIDGRQMYEIDPLGLKRVINGVDQLAAQRSALGL